MQLWVSRVGFGAFVSVLCFAQFPGLDIIRLQAPCSDLLELRVPRTREEGRKESKKTRRGKERRLAESSPKVGQREAEALM